MNVHTENVHTCNVHTDIVHTHNVHTHTRQVSTNCCVEFYTQRATVFGGLRTTVLAAVEAGIHRGSPGVERGQSILLERVRGEATTHVETYRQVMQVLVNRSFCVDVTSYSNALK